jgi:hypothetical protein
MQHRFSNGQAIQFCVACLSQYGYPSGSSLRRGEGATQAVTMRDGMALCEQHWSNKTMIEKLKVVKHGD